MRPVSSQHIHLSTAVLIWLRLRLRLLQRLWLPIGTWLPIIILGAGATLFGVEMAGAGEGPERLFEGSFDASALQWRHDDHGCYTPVLPATDVLAETDKPLLACRTLLLLIPPDASLVDLEVVPLQTHRMDLPGELCLGGLLHTGAGDAVPVNQVLVNDTSYPAVWGQFGGTHSWRGFRIATLQVYPLRLLRDTMGNWTELEVLDRYLIRPRYSGEVLPADMAVRRRRLPRERQHLESQLEKICANRAALAGYRRQDGVLIPRLSGGFQPSRTPSLSGSAVSYLIITSVELASEFQRLADFKTAQGIPAVVKSVSWITSNYRHGADLPETLRMFIRDAYEKWGVEYVLLGGDSDVLPARHILSTFYPLGGTTPIPADLYFACLDGNWNADGDHLYGEPFSDSLDPGDDADLLSEVFLGRAPVSNAAAAATFVDKVIQYEQRGTESVYLNRSLFAAEVLSPDDYQSGDPVFLDGADFAEGIIVDHLLPCSDMSAIRMYETHTLWPDAEILNRAALIDSLSSGHYGIVDHVGHGFFYNISAGDDNVFVADADGLTNGDHTFLIYALNCASAAFDYACFMERCLQNRHGGSVASIGSARAAFPFTANIYQHEFFRQLFCEAPLRLGELMALSRLIRIAYVHRASADRWTFMSYTLLGDPSLAVWTGSPRQAIVTAPPALLTGAQDISVAVSVAGIPVPAARVCLAKEDDDYGVAMTDAAGEASLAFTPTSGGDALLTVTGPNLALQQIVIPVSTGGEAYVALHTVARLADGGLDGSAGNGNGLAEAGETIALWLSFEDTGDVGTGGCVAQLDANAPGVSLLVPTAVVGDVPPQGIVIAENPFLFHLAADIMDGTHLPFEILVTDSNENNYASELTLTCLAPELEVVALVWNDDIYGDGDGIRENDERVTIAATLENLGAGSADEVIVRLRTRDPEVTLFDSVATYDRLEFRQASSQSGPLSFSDADVTTEAECWLHFADNHGRILRHDFHLLAPSVPEGLATNSSLGPNAIAIHWTRIPDPDRKGYHVYRRHAAEADFTRINTYLIDGVSYYLDSGLDDLTRYEYRVTAVASSLVEGAPSATVARYTAPPELPGFPLSFAQESGGHCAVGDVTGDGALEIVLGADEVYVWKADGSELFDGDADPQTIGPVTRVGGSFQPAGITLADLDGLPGLEIVASEKNARRIHVYRADGTELPGWPQSLREAGNGWNWTTPAVGDVDGDGEPEVVVNTLDGRTWVWHRDGTELVDGDADPTTNGVFIVHGGDHEWGFSSPALFDLDGDQAREIIFGTKYFTSATNYLHAFRHDGTEPPGFPYDTGNGSIVCSPTVADLDGDGTWEIIFHTQNNHLYVVQQDGSDYPGFPIAFISNLGSLPSPSPAVGDFDGDGELEIVAVSVQDEAHADIYVFDTDSEGGSSGLPLPGWPVALPGNSEGSPVVGDIDGDDIPDILFGIGGGDETTPNNLYAWKADASPIDGFPLTLGGPLRSAPFLCDLDQDGDVEIVYGGWDRLLHVWDMPFTYTTASIPWSTFRGHVCRDGVYRSPMITEVHSPPAPLTELILVVYPNPFNPAVRIRLHLPGEPGRATPLALGVYDLQGRLVHVLHVGETLPGWHTWTWNGRDQDGKPQGSGVYFLRGRNGNHTVTRKISLIR